MKLVVLGDLHLVSPDDGDRQRCEQRGHFAKAWPSFAAMTTRVREESPDLVIALGDLVDWYSPANRDFALSMLEELKVPWLVTPGNHDLSHPARAEGIGQAMAQEEARQGWEQAGVPLGNRVVDTGAARLVLMDSATSFLPAGTQAWLEEAVGGVDGSAPKLVFTHVPVNIAPTVDYILSVEPQRNLSKYVQQNCLFDACLRGKVDAVFTGHLHFPGDLEVDGTRLFMRSLTTTAVDRAYRGQGAAMVLELGNGSWSAREIRVGQAGA